MTIYTEAWLAERTTDDAGCQIWNLQINRYKAPITRTSASDGPRKMLQVRRVVWEMRNGPIPDGLMVTVSCGNPRCVKCLELVTFSEVNRRTWQRPDIRARRVEAFTRSSRALRAKLDMEKARYIRATDKTLVEVAAELGISVNLASNVRRGVAWREEGNPFAGLGAR